MAVDPIILTNSLLTVANHISKKTSYFRVDKKSEEIKKNSFFRRHCLFFFYSKKSHSKHIESVINKHVQLISGFGQEAFVEKNGELSDLFLAVQKYNQTVSTAAQHKLLSKSSLANRISLNIVNNDNVSQLNPSKVIAVTDERMAEELQNDRPETLTERRFGKKCQIRRYPGDHLDHAKEAGRIFTSTQKERLLSKIGRLVECVAKIFHFKVHAFQKYHYRNHNETDDQIYAPRTNPLSPTDEPTSYWLGHATLFLSVPIKSEKGTVASFNVITDPVEGDLNQLLYPRQTRFARTMEETPAPEVYLLSHNHMDHYSRDTIKKIFAQRPIMIVPKGDGERYIKQAKALGFDGSNIIELDWWEKKDIEFEKNGERYHMQICATPARHWSGLGPCNGHESTFLGYVIQGCEGGDIYFAGDTARLNANHLQKLREHFNIRWNFQPGGPDEVRKDMESTHQASVDGLWMHFEVMLNRIYQRGMHKDDFFARAKEFKTIYMHTMTYKLGNLHLSDTKDSLERVLKALSTYEETDAQLAKIEETVQLCIDFRREKFKSYSGKKRAKEETKLTKKAIEMRHQLLEKELGLKSYEKQVYDELCQFAKNVILEGENVLLPNEVAQLLQETVIVPKIGARLGLATPKEEQIEKTYF